MSVAESDTRGKPLPRSSYKSLRGLLPLLKAKLRQLIACVGTQAVSPGAPDFLKQPLSASALRSGSTEMIGGLPLAFTSAIVPPLGGFWSKSKLVSTVRANPVCAAISVELFERIELVIVTKPLVGLVVSAAGQPALPAYTAPPPTLPAVLNATVLLYMFNALAALDEHTLMLMALPSSAAELPLIVLSKTCLITPFPNRDQMPPPLLELPVTALPLIVLEAKLTP